ncbi:MAG TPA: DUF2905 domain-containing protein [Nitrospirota bacterium]|nr:DUF2905 domain-containing protein [Nitrospirota bacterium]
MGEMAKMFILLGAVLIVLGLILLLLQKTPFLGKLPGDILIKREHVTIYFPLATSIIISIIISLILYFLNRFR